MPRHGNVVAGHDRANRNVGWREGGDGALAEHCHHLLHRQPDEEVGGDCHRDGLEDRLVLLVGDLVLEVVLLERVEEGRLDLRVDGDLGHHRRRRRDEGYREGRHRRGRGPGKGGEGGVEGEAGDHDLALPLLPGLRHALDDGLDIDLVVLLLADPGLERREVLEFRAVEAAGGADGRDRHDLPVLELRLNAPEVDGLDDLVDGLVDEGLHLVADLLGGVGVILVRRRIEEVGARRRRPAGDELRDGEALCEVVAPRRAHRLFPVDGERLLLADEPALSDLFERQSPAWHRDLVSGTCCRDARARMSRRVTGVARVQEPPVAPRAVAQPAP